MVKFAVEFWWKMLLTISPSKRSSKISFQTSPEVRHQLRRKLRQLHSGNRWCLAFAGFGRILPEVRLRARLCANMTFSGCTHFRCTYPPPLCRDFHRIAHRGCIAGLGATKALVIFKAPRVPLQNKLLFVIESVAQTAQRAQRLKNFKISLWD